MKQGEEVQKLNMIATWLAKYLIDTNANKFVYTLENLTGLGNEYGDFEITVIRKPKKENQ